LAELSAELIELNEKNGAVTFRLRAQPRASKTEITGEHGGAVKLRIAAPPVDGKANDEVVRFFSKLFEVPIRSIEMVSGDSSRDKLIRIHNISMARVQEVLGK
jgi:uncharacterized protein